MLLFSKCLIELTCEAIWSWAFVCWKIFNHSFNFSACGWSVHIFYFFLIQSWQVVQATQQDVSSGPVSEVSSLFTATSQHSHYRLNHPHTPSVKNCLPWNQSLVPKRLGTSGFHGLSFLIRCYKVSVLDAIPPCVITSSSAKQGGSFAFCLIPINEEAVLGSTPFFLPHMHLGSRKSLRHWGCSGNENERARVDFKLGDLMWVETWSLLFKIIKNFKIAVASIKPSKEPLWVWGFVWLHRSQDYETSLGERKLSALAMRFILARFEFPL